MMGGWRIAWVGAAFVLTAFAMYSAGSITHGFVAYYAAGRLLMDGQLGLPAYDDRWFGEYLQQLTGSNIREIFTPNPPTMALMAWPLAGIDHHTARLIWLIASVVVFAAAVFALARCRAERHGSVPVVAVLLAMLSPAVFSNIRVGQAYLIVFACFGAAGWCLYQRRDAIGGAVLGLALGLKLSGTAWLVVLAAERRWRAIGAAIAVAATLAFAVTPWIDPAMWWQHPAVVRAFVERPSGSVTAYQTTLSLARRLCIADSTWNPAPAASCEGAAFVVPYLLLGAAIAITVALVGRAHDPGASLAAGATLSLLVLPASAEVHFVLLGIPLLIVPLRPLELAVIAFLLIIPLELTAERFTSGWAVLLAYPRLYAAWLLWAAGIKELLKTAKH
jgi:hypothetical protein